MRATLLGIVAAVLLHGVVLLFGGLLIPRPEETKKPAKVESVDLVADADPDKPEDEKKDAEQDRPEAEEAMETAAEPPPDARELTALQEQAAAAAVPELAALSLGALESALNPGGGGDVFGGSLNLSGGGRIGGTGSAAALIENPGGDTVFAMPDLDQKPRAIFQAEPVYPFELRQKKVEGTVYVRFVIDQEGRVQNPTVEQSTHRAFDKPALDAVRQWKFEPAVRDGRRVQTLMRVPIRFARG